MTTLLTIAELLAGEALLSPGGPVDRQTAVAGDENPLWQLPAATTGAPVEGYTEVAEETLVAV